MIEELNKKLNEGVVTVVFTKVDGSERTMKCTKNMNMIPEEFHPKGEKRNGYENVATVFDTEKNEWRSFIWDNVVSYD